MAAMDSDIVDKPIYKARWSTAEETTLVQAVLERESRLFGSMVGCGSTKHRKAKEDSWDEVATILNTFVINFLSNNLTILQPDILDMVWNSSDYGGVDEVWVSTNEVWIPHLILTTPSNEIDTYAKSWQMVQYEETGRAEMTTGGLIHSTCSVDIGKYPFDKQVCKSEFQTWSYDEDEVILLTSNAELDLTLYSENDAWSIESTSIKTPIVNEWSQLEIEISLCRRSEFIVVNIILPILFLSLINVFVYFLVPESGERVSFCITVLLAIAVFMTIISDTLPKSSSPLPKISYKLMADMIISALITLVVIFNLKLYYRNDDDSIPVWLKSVYHSFYCTRKTCVTSQKIRPKRMQKTEDQVMVLSDVDKDNNKDHKDMAVLAGTKPEPAGSLKDEDIPYKETCPMEITWRDVSKMVDSLASVLFISLSIINFSIFLLYVTL